MLYTEAIEQWQKHVTASHPVSAGMSVRLLRQALSDGINDELMLLHGLRRLGPQHLPIDLSLWFLACAIQPRYKAGTMLYSPSFRRKTTFVLPFIEAGVFGDVHIHCWNKHIG